MKGPSSLRAGVVGLGQMGKWHLQKYLQMELSGDFSSLNMVGIFDPHYSASESKSKSETERKKLFTFPNLNPLSLASSPHLEKELCCFSSVEALAEEVDLVTVATPASTHFSIVKTFLERGVHVLVEKPLATSWEEGQSLVRLAEAQKLLLAVGYSERCHPLLVQAFPTLRQMRELYFCRETRESQRGRDVDVILDLMVHDLDILYGLWGREASLSGSGDLEDLEKIQICEPWGERDREGLVQRASVQLLFPEGQKATLKASRVEKESCRFCVGMEREEQILLDFSNHYLGLNKSFKWSENKGPENKLNKSFKWSENKGPEKNPKNGSWTLFLTPLG